VALPIYETQKAYPQVKRELLGMVNALKNMQVYLMGQNFILETDCLPVIGMINKPDVADATTHSAVQPDLQAYPMTLI
jgi:hypothetical protein